MAQGYLARMAWLNKIHGRVDRMLHEFSIYAMPVMIGLASVVAVVFLDNHYHDTAANSLQFRLVADPTNAFAPQQAGRQLAAKAPVLYHDIQLDERPFWFSFEAQRNASSHSAFEFPSRHATEIACWDGHNFEELGRADRKKAQGAISPVKAGFALRINSQSTISQVLCRARFSGPARLSVVQWSPSQLEASSKVFHRNAGLLDGGLIVLAVFMLVTALVNRESIYVLFAAWLIINLRVAALSAGWDFQWLGKTIPSEWLLTVRGITLAVYYVLTITLFNALFREDLERVGYASLIRAAQWSCVFLVPLALVLPYNDFLPICWTAAGIGSVALVFLLIRILKTTRSTVAIWYGASIAITLSASVYEVMAAALGIRGLIGTVNSVTAALSSSLLASLALAAQMRTEHMERLEAQAELRHNYEAMPIGLFTLDLQGKFLNANPALAAMLGRNVLTEDDNTWGKYFGADAWRKLFEQVHAYPEAELEIQSGNESNADDSKRFLVKAALAHGKIEGWIQDVTEKSKATENLQFLATRDPLTKVYNRHGAEKMFESVAAQINEGKPLALAYLDLDRFKLINDMYGHAMGDEVLKKVCERVASVLTGAQCIGRVGGDEFVIVMPGTPIESAKWICRGIVQAICNTPYRIADKAFQIGMSIGLIEVSHGTPFKDAMANADRACHEAKSRHSDGMVVYEKNAKAFSDRAAEVSLVERLADQSALKDMFLEMQPIMSLKTPFETHNFEVLLRMRTNTGGIVPAGRIIAAAESSAQTGVIDRWVLSTTLAWLDIHFDRLPRTRFVCMNLSGASLNDERFIQDAYAMLAENRRAASRLCVEITESVALHDLNNTRRFIEQVRSYGAKVALDDFGAGYTSFAYLKELPADVLKIDGGFVVNMNQHPTNVSIVETIVNLAGNLGMKTIAEWAEDNATVQTLAEIGVDYVQGYAVARSQAPDKILQVESSANFIVDEDLKKFVHTLGQSDTGLAQQDLLDHMLVQDFH